MTSKELFFTIQPEDRIIWREGKKSSKELGIDLASTYGFSFTGDVRIAVDGYVHAELRMMFPTGITANGKNYFDFYLDVADQAKAWAVITSTIRELTATKEAN